MMLIFLIAGLLCAPLTTAAQQRPMSSNQGYGNCVLPPYPAHGRYVMVGDEDAQPGDRFPMAIIKITCDDGYDVVDRDNVTCIGSWVDSIPKCIRYCELQPHASVIYKCVLEKNDVRNSWPCRRREFPGTKVEPECRINYCGSTSNMVCQSDGT